jgi:hypothetical protein
MLRALLYNDGHDYDLRTCLLSLLTRDFASSVSGAHSSQGFACHVSRAEIGGRHPVNDDAPDLTAISAETYLAFAIPANVELQSLESSVSIGAAILCRSWWPVVLRDLQTQIGACQSISKRYQGASRTPVLT